MTLHPRVREAAGGRLPEWARAGTRRRAHMDRVAELMGAWAEESEASEEDVARWRAAAHLHDALREADPDELRTAVPEPFRALPGGALHGPAAAERLRNEGVEDEALLRAVAYHTVGHPDLDRLGRALYIADFVEPGRTSLAEWREELRARMPGSMDAVVREVVGARMRHLVDRGSPLLEPTVAFWNALVGGQARSPVVRAGEVTTADTGAEGAG